MKKKKRGSMPATAPVAKKPKNASSSNAMLSALWSSLFHPSELFALVKFKVSSSAHFTAEELYRQYGQGRQSYLKCYQYLDMTSRSFARVIRELHPELRHAVCIFYLVLRGLDTIEDDMTLDLDFKSTQLCDFYRHLDEKGWSFQDNGPEEKDRMLLVEFYYIIEEFLLLKPEYQTVIRDITRRMGAGMAEFRDPTKIVKTVADYNLYCHFVAGLVGIGLTALFVNSGLESHPKLVLSSEVKSLGGGIIHDHEYLSNRMGLFLQKVNIIKDFMGDLKEGRVFWPMDIWKQYLPDKEKALLEECSQSSPDNVSKIYEDVLKSLGKPENRKRAMGCLNHLCSDALELVPDCLEYMSYLKEPSVFRFAAIPQVMAIASITLFFNNPSLFSSLNPVKIRRGQSVKLILDACDNMHSLKKTYQKYVYQLHSKNHECVGKNEYDKSFVKMAVHLGAIQRWLNVHTMQEYAELSSQASKDGGNPVGTHMALSLSNEMKRSWVDVWLVWILVLIVFAYASSVGMLETFGL